MKIFEIIIDEGSLQKDINTLSKQQQGQINLKKNVRAHDEMTKKLGVDPLKSTQSLMYAKKHGIDPGEMVKQSPQYKMRLGRGARPAGWNKQSGNIARAKNKAIRDA